MLVLAAGASSSATCIKFYPPLRCCCCSRCWVLSDRLLVRVLVYVRSTHMARLLLYFRYTSSLNYLQPTAAAVADPAAGYYFTSMIHNYTCTRRHSAGMYASKYFVFILCTCTQKHPSLFALDCKKKRSCLEHKSDR